MRQCSWCMYEGQEEANVNEVWVRTGRLKSPAEQLRFYPVGNKYPYKKGIFLSTICWVSWVPWKQSLSQAFSFKELGRSVPSDKRVWAPG